MKKVVVTKITTLFLSLFFLLVTLPSRGDVPIDQIKAIVNNVVITQSQFNNTLRLYQEQAQQGGGAMPSENELRDKALQHLVDEQLQLQLAQKSGIKVSDSDVDQAINQVAKQNNLSVTDLQSKVTQQGMSYDQYRQQIRNQIIISQLQQQVVAPKVSVSLQETADALTTLTKQPKQDATYHLLDMYVPLPDITTPDQISAAKKQADVLVAKLRAGADFQQTVESSTGSAAPLQGGDLGWHKLMEMPDPFIAIVKSMRVGDIGGPIQTPNGIHIIKLIEMRGGNPIPQQLTETHARHILIKPTPLENDAQVKDRLARIRIQILNGTDFAAAAATNSQDPGSKTKGGDLGWVQPGMLDPTFEAQMDQLKPNQISEPFKTQFGWHIVQVLGRRTTQDIKAYSQQQAQQVVYQRKFQEAVQNWLRTLRSEAYIKVY